MIVVVRNCVIEYTIISQTLNSDFYIKFVIFVKSLFLLFFYITFYIFLHELLSIIAASTSLWTGAISFFSIDSMSRSAAILATWAKKHLPL
ncbi:hypothetical protein Bccel_0467 [Pseudobacteroides cellulosolvens ATCC 35603 = DSM 2933]|uniref:Uncharacterized protein n=1 Tax=Pseudobacteroides cellulosolvens ATCC 35603 = DSM 2933 TaxID=398512 RepID=A0A0L6JHN8_9FIRM|nr:hypothetical protein Bccel_0467 [Pseudobacteroides cellulosolvens ATCC 35603 = DSM 2933]